MVADVTGSAQHQIGSGVSSPLIFKNFTQGSIQTTGGVDDAAIQGDGFFVVRPAAAGSPVLSGTDLSTDQFTRAGDFQVDQNGILTTATGQRVQGWSLNTATNTVDPSDPIGDIIVPVGTNRAAKATTSFNANLNLDASAAAGRHFLRADQRLRFTRQLARHLGHLHQGSTPLTLGPPPYFQPIPP